MQLGKRRVCQTSSPYIIAEIGVNHEGSLGRAKSLIDQAKEGGADAAKFQSYKAETLASKNSPSYWNLNEEPTKSQFKLFKKYDSFGPDHFMELADHCKKIEIDFLSTPFDDIAVDFLDRLVPFFKIASADITNVPLLRNVGGRGKPVILSTGASTLAEIESALEILKLAGCTDIALLHCILNYPTDNINAHLNMIKGLRRVFPLNIVGYSDHTLPDPEMSALTTAYLLGAVIIEKHFTDDKSLKGNDHYHAMDKNDLSRFVRLVEKINTLMGLTMHKAPIPTEEISRKNARRSIVLAKKVTTGQRITASDIICKRPGTGIGAIHWDELIGRYAVKSLPEDHILSWDDLRLDGD